MGTSKPNKGEREARDIIEAAIDQGWEFERKPGRSHSRLIPPNGCNPIPVSCTPSDRNWMRSMVREMRRTGCFTWPPPHITKKETPMTETDPEIPAEEWAPIVRTVAEISNGGLVRDAGTKEIIHPGPNGIVKVFSTSGFEVDKSVRGECRKAFGHSPIKGIHRMPAVEPQTPEKEPDEGHWQPVLIEGVIEGYEVNENAVVLAPKTSHYLNRTVLTVDYNRRRDKRPVVNLRRTDGKFKQYALDEIVLEAFETRPGPDYIPEPIDGDPANCIRSNLRWKQDPTYRPPKPKEPEPVQVVEKREAEMRAALEGARDFLDGVSGKQPITLTVAADLGITASNQPGDYSAEDVSSVTVSVTRNYTTTPGGWVVSVTDGVVILPSPILAADLPEVRQAMLMAEKDSQR